MAVHVCGDTSFIQIYSALLFNFLSIDAVNISVTFPGDPEEVGQAGAEATGPRGRERPGHRAAEWTGKWRHLSERTLSHEDHVAPTSGPLDDASEQCTVALTFFRSLKTFPLPFLRMRNKCKIINVQRNRKHFRFKKMPRAVR